MYTGLEIKRFVKENLLNVDHIVELGCGYGGQSIILGDLLPVKKYTYIDLPEVNLLINKFLSNFSISFETEFSSIGNHKKENYSLFISNYSFSELPRNLQNKAINNFMKRSQGGYLIINSDNFSKKYNFLSQEDYQKLFKNFIIEEEVPQTSLIKPNYVYKFINNNNF